MIIVKAPVRISIGGGGTDLPSYFSKFGGEWISAAIDQYIYIIINKRFENTIRVSYSKTEEVDNPAKIQHPIVREVLKFLHIDGGLEIVSVADIPSNTGLGTSGSFTVALLMALHTYLQDTQKRNVPNKNEIAEQAYYIASNLLKEPSGKQDEYISAIGGLTNFSVSKKGKVKVDPFYPLKIPYEVVNELEHNLLMFYTGIRRSSTNILKKQAVATQNNKKDMIQNLHIVKSIGQQIKKALEKGDLTQFGKLLDLHWREKVKRADTSNAKINEWYQIAKEAGAIGGKLMGAGGGGFFLFYCDKNKNKLREAMRTQGLVEKPFNFDFEGVKVITNFI